jgi:hypothetical protein
MSREEENRSENDYFGQSRSMDGVGDKVGWEYFRLSERKDDQAGDRTLDPPVSWGMLYR